MPLSMFITLTHAATKSFTNACLEGAIDGRNEVGPAPLMLRQPARNRRARQTSLRPTLLLQTEQPGEVRGGAQACRLTRCSDRELFVQLASNYVSRRVGTGTNALDQLQELRIGTELREAVPVLVLAHRD